MQKLPKSRWSTEDLARRLCHSLDIARQAVERLAAKGYTDCQEPSNNLSPEKLISETAYLLFRASAAREWPEIGRCIQSVAESLLPYARGERVLLGMCLEPALALDYAQAHIYLTKLGYPDLAFDAVLQGALDSNAHGGHERPPHRMLEQDWLARIWGGVGLSTAAKYAARHSALGQPMDLLSGRRDDVYALTHALMFITDLKVHSWRLPRSASEILCEAEAAIGWCLDEEDYDLAGEVILAWPLIGKPLSATAIFAFRVLAHVEDQAGFLPSPSTRLRRLNELTGDERTQYLLATAYHTAYVMGLVCAAALHQRKPLPVKIPRSRLLAGSAVQILKFLDTCPRDRHWRVEFDQLAAPERDSIAGLVLAIALRQKARQRDFGALHELLGTAYSLGLADCPAASQAAELLQRVAGAERILAGKARKVP